MTITRMFAVSAFILFIGVSHCSWAKYPGQQYLLRAAEQIDILVERQLKAVGKAPNPIASDHVFLKRAYLGIIGRIPSYEEGQSYLNSTDEYKKFKLIWRLVNSPGYDSAQFNYWADLLRLQLRQAGQGESGLPYIEFVRDAIRRNVPYDQFVRDLLTGSGSTWKPGGGASGYFRRDFGMSLDNFAMTMQVFSGVQMQCAQCHNHPFEPWTQKDFYEMAAFFNVPKRGGYNGFGPDLDFNIRDVRKLTRKGADDEARAYLQKVNNRLRSIASYHVPDHSTGKIKLPKDYQYVNAKPNQELQARTVFGKAITFDGDPSETDPRAQFATWLATPEHPYFTQVIANRLWEKTMGVGLFEPVDDIREDTKASNPRLLDFLEKQMKHFEYDLKVYQAMLYCTDLFQREATAYVYDEAVPYHFPGPVIRRMAAEQIWDSLMTLKVPDLDSYTAPPRKGLYQEYASLQSMDTEALVSFIMRLVDSPKARKKNASFSQALYSGDYLGAGGAGDVNMGMMGMSGMMDSSMNPSSRGKGKGKGKKRLPQVPLAYKRLQANTAANRAIMPLIKQLLQFEKARQYDKVDETQQVLLRKAKIYAFNEMEVHVLVRYAKSKSMKGRGRYVRASELNAPVRSDHLLRVFGAADRAYIDNSSLLPNAPQSLELMNGFVYRDIIRDRKSVLHRNIEGGASLDEKIERLFLSVYCRPPSDAEIRQVRELVDASSAQNMDGAVWSLLNSLEFLFIL